MVLFDTCTGLGKRPFLLLTLLFLLFILLNLQSFLDNVWFYASGSVALFTVKGQWWFAALNILIFVSLLLLLNRKDADWKTYGLFSAFVISLFVEMYGTSLALYFISANILGAPLASGHPVLFNLDILGVGLGFDLWMSFGAVVIISGMLIITLGWHQLWSSKHELFTGGLYKYSRHPQYVGFLYTIWGWMIAWPTITTLVFTPILTYAYIHAARKEEKRMLAADDGKYKEYMEKTLFLL